MEKKELVCIICPMGCMMEVVIKPEGEIKVTGNTCPRGKIYAKKEVTAPTRVVTTSVKVEGKKGQVSCKTREDIPKSKIFEIIKELKNDFEYVLIDCPAGIEQGFKNAVIGADKAIVVTIPEVSAVRDADRIIGLLDAQGIKEPLLLINRLRVDMVKKGLMLSIEDVIDILAVKLLGVVVDDENVIISTNRGQVSVDDLKSKAGQAYRNVVKRILGEEIPLMDLNKGNFASRLKTFLGI